jgi:DNA-binding NarL/FixJ family response regulator
LTAPLRVLVADDSAVYRRAAADVVTGTPGFLLAGAVSSGEEAVAMTLAGEIDIVLIDARMPGIGGIEAARLICAAQPETEVTVLTAEPESVSTALGELASRIRLLDKRSLGPSTIRACRAEPGLLSEPGSP